MKKPKRKANVIHRSKLPHAKKGQFDGSNDMISALKRQEQELLDTTGPIGDVAKHVVLGEKPVRPTQLILPPSYDQPRPSQPSSRLVLPGTKSQYQRGDIIEYQNGRCRFHVVVSNGPIHGLKKIPCYSLDLAKRVSDKVLGVTHQQLSEAERQGLFRRLVEDPRGYKRRAGMQKKHWAAQ